MSFVIFLYIYYLMRKVYALLLLFPLMSLLVGAVWLPSHCPAVAKGQCPMMAKMDAGCRKAMMLRHRRGMGMEGMAAGKGKQEKKGGSCCMDCPIFYLVTFNPLIRIELKRTSIKTVYTVMSDNNLSDYYKQHWKPPCMGLLS
jgi:hypothetical protein